MKKRERGEESGGKCGLLLLCRVECGCGRCVGREEGRGGGRPQQPRPGPGRLVIL